MEKAAEKDATGHTSEWLIYRADSLRVDQSSGRAGTTNATRRVTGQSKSRSADRVRLVREALAVSGNLGESHRNEARSISRRRDLRRQRPQDSLVRHAT